MAGDAPGIAELKAAKASGGGVVILRSGKNAREVIAAVKDKLETLKESAGKAWRELNNILDRSQLISSTAPSHNLSGKLLESLLWWR